MKRTLPFATGVSDLLIVGGGIVTTIATMVLAFVLLQRFQFITWIAWAVVPVGALCLGALSAMGFLWAAKQLQRRMSILATLFMVAILGCGYFGHYYLLYHDGWAKNESGEYQRLRELTDFASFYRWEMSHRVYTRYGIVPKDAQPVGKRGYLFAGLELAGFLLGGVLVMYYLSQLPYCDRCSRFYDRKAFGLPADEKLVERLEAALKSRDEASILATIPQWQIRAPRTGWIKAEAGFLISVRYCRQCRQAVVLSLEVQHLGEASSRRICQAPVSLDAARSILNHFAVV